MTRLVRRPGWLDSLLFLALMSGPPKFRDRDLLASLAGVIDASVLIQVGVWVCGGVWVLLHVYPMLVRRSAVPLVNSAQVAGALFIVALSLSAWESPGFLMTAFTLGQFAVMLGFAWVFTHLFGPEACLRHLFAGVTVLALMILGAAVIAPELVGDEARLRGDVITDAGSLAVVGLVLCLSNIPRLQGVFFWGACSLFGFLLFASRTRSAMGALLVFLVIGLVYGKRLRVRQLILPLALVALSVVAMDALSSTTDYFVRERESVESMSDRIPLWTYLTEVVMRDAPFTGLGYYAASRVLAPAYNEALGNAHSVFFEVLIGGGIIGAAMYVVLCVVLLWYALPLLWLASSQPSAVAAAGLLTSALLMGITSLATLQPGPLGFAFWASTALLPALWREAARGQVAAGRARFRAQRSPLQIGTGRRLAAASGRAE
jgi:O-antigen ligase